MSLSIRLRALAGACLMACAPWLPAAAHGPVVRLDGPDPMALFTVDNGTIETRMDGERVVYRWRIRAGQTSTLELRDDHPLLNSLRYYDTLGLRFRVAGGQVNALDLTACGHVSGPRQFKVYQWTLGVLTTPKEVWHDRFLRLYSPNWFVWDDKDGTGATPFFRFEALALTPDTVIEFSDLVFTRELVRLKPDFELPATWPELTRHDDGSASYLITHWVQNASGRPTTLSARILSSNALFSVGLQLAGEVPELPAQGLGRVAEAAVKHAAKIPLYVVAHISKEALARAAELAHEPLRLSVAVAEHPDAPAIWQMELTRPMSLSLERQVVIGKAERDTIRAELKAGNEELAGLLGLAGILKTADELVAKDLRSLPRNRAHVKNNWIGDWRPGAAMSEVVNTKTGEKQTGSLLAGQTWCEYLSQRGRGCQSLAEAYLYTGDEKYATKAAELFRLYAQQYGELPWTHIGDVPWSNGPTILSSSRSAWSSTYGSNWYFRWHCRLLSAITDSPVWTPEFEQWVYRGFVVPYALELMKFPGGISNMTDITNHNVLLLGLAFADANLVRWALQSDPGLLRRLMDITADGFSSEGRPVSYHFAAMQEYVPSLAFIQRAGLDLGLPTQRLAAAVRMPLQRAALTGVIPSTGDSGRGLLAGPNAHADRVLSVAPAETWLRKAGVGSTLPLKLERLATGETVEPGAWRELIETSPRLFADGGLAILRAGTTVDTQIMATLDYGKNCFHAHLDRNQITLLAFGKIFTQGPGSLYNVGRGGMTRNPDARISSFAGSGSLGQNVIMVDACDQIPAIGRLLAWSADPEYQLAASRVAGVAPGVEHTRALILVDGLLLVLDEIAGTDEHTYDFVYHNLGRLSLGSGWTAEPLAEPLATTANYDNIVDAARLVGAGPVHLAWDLSRNLPPAALAKADEAGTVLPTVKLDLWQVASEAGEAYTGVTGINNRDTAVMPDSAPSLFHRVTGTRAFFGTVLEPNKGANRVTALAMVGTDGIRVTLSDGKERVVSLSAVIREHAVEE